MKFTRISHVKHVLILRSIIRVMLSFVRGHTESWLKLYNVCDVKQFCQYNSQSPQAVWSINHYTGHCVKASSRYERDKERHASCVTAGALLLCHTCYLSFTGGPHFHFQALELCIVLLLCSNCAVQLNVKVQNEIIRNGRNIQIR